MASRTHAKGLGAALHLLFTVCLNTPTQCHSSPFLPHFSPLTAAPSSLQVLRASPFLMSQNGLD